jgi:hypothetical protein
MGLRCTWQSGESWGPGPSFGRGWATLPDQDYRELCRQPRRDPDLDPTLKLIIAGATLMTLDPISHLYLFSFS